MGELVKFAAAKLSPSRPHVVPITVPAMLERILPESVYSVLDSLHLLTPLNASLSIVLVIVLISLVPSTPTVPTYPLATTPNVSYNYRPLYHAPSIKWERYTPRELAKFDGKGSAASDGQRGPEPKILFAIRRKVYDVTSGKNFYGPGQLARFSLE